MKIKDGFVTRQIGDKIVAITVGKHTKDFDGMITLNDTGLFIWNCLKNDTDKESVANKIIMEYDVSKEDAIKEIDKFVEILRQNNLIEE